MIRCMLAGFLCWILVPIRILMDAAILGWQTATYISAGLGWAHNHRDD